MGSLTVPIEMLGAWPVLIIVLMWLDRRYGPMPLFIVYSYIASLVINHWFGALVHIVPTDASEFAIYTPGGFEMSTWGLAFLVAGAAVYRPPRLEKLKAQRLAAMAAPTANAQHVVGVLVLLGLASWVLDLTPIANVPSISAAISGGKQFLIGAICLKCWLAWINHDRWGLLLWLSLGFAFPFYTVLFQGFLGFGISYLLSILIFVGTFYRPRWRVVAAAVIGVYAGLSLYIGYVTDRSLIRDAVWGGRSMEVRLEAAAKMIHDMAPFDPFNDFDREMVDQRLNQNWLAGASLNYVPELRPYADGETLYLALIAFIPRAIWPNKPAAGSGNLVTDYTGIRFAENTSVGIGQVMEFYVNFGWLGIAAGFFLFGLGLRYIDVQVSTSILTQRWSNAGLWFAVGLSAIQSSGQLIEVTSSMSAAAVFGLLAMKISKYSARRRRAIPAAGPLGPRRIIPVVEARGAPRHRFVDRA